MELADYRRSDTEDVIQDVIKRYRLLTNGKQLGYTEERAIREILEEKYFVGTLVEPKPVKWYFRLSYPLYIFWLLFHFVVIRPIKWVLTGDNNFNKKSPYFRLMIKWEKGVEGKL